MSTWILVANASQAYLYSTENLHTDELDLVKEFKHPESREKGLKLTSDRPGHYKTDHQSRSAYEKSHPKEDEAEVFARELAAMLKEGNNNHEYSELLLVAPPHFYGLLNKNIDFSLDKLLHIGKDYTHLTARDLIVQLHEHIYK
jgi:protein required for attachment to host cells